MGVMIWVIYMLDLGLGLLFGKFAFLPDTRTLDLLVQFGVCCGSGVWSACLEES